MKNNKKIILAAGAAALGLVAATGVTSGFAWFATNSQVSVTGLQLKANSNTEFLLIAEGANKSLDAMQGNNETPKVGAKTATHELEEDGEHNPIVPSYKPVTFLGDDAHLHEGTYAEAEGAAAAVAADYTITNCNNTTNWGTANSDVWNEAQVTKEVTPFAANYASFGEYVGVFPFTLALEAGSAAVTGIYVRSVTFATNVGAKAIIAGEVGGALYGANSSTTSAKICDGFANNATKQVNVYLFIDGRDAAVKSSDADTLLASLSFVLGTSNA